MNCSFIWKLDCKETKLTEDTEYIGYKKCCDKDAVLLNEDARLNGTGIIF